MEVHPSGKMLNGTLDGQILEENGWILKRQ